MILQVSAYWIRISTVDSIVLVRRYGTAVKLQHIAVPVLTFTHSGVETGVHMDRWKNIQFDQLDGRRGVVRILTDWMDGSLDGWFIGWTGWFVRVKLYSKPVRGRST